MFLNLWVLYVYGPAPDVPGKVLVPQVPIAPPRKSRIAKVPVIPAGFPPGVGDADGVGDATGVGLATGVGDAPGVGDATGVGDAPGVGVGVTVPHVARIKTAWNRLAARNVKATGSAGLMAVNVTLTGANVPGVNAGMLTTALTTEPGTTVIVRVPVPVSTWSTVTLPGPLVTPKEAIPLGIRGSSVRIVIGVQVSAHRTRINAA